jgi:YggT family protein
MRADALAIAADNWEITPPGQAVRRGRSPLAARGQGGYTSPVRTEAHMIPLLNFLAMVITLYMWVIIISAILSWLIAFNVINRHNQVVYMIADSLQRLTEPALRPIRNVMPDFGGLDISPVVLILVLIFLRDVVIHGWLYPAFI